VYFVPSSKTTVVLQMLPPDAIDLLLSVKQKLLLAKHWVLLTINLTSTFGFGLTTTGKVNEQLLPFDNLKVNLIVFVPGVLNTKVGVSDVVLLPIPSKSQTMLLAPGELQVKRIGSPTQAGAEAVKLHCAFA
jgi:hypothetical protein